MAGQSSVLRPFPLGRQTREQEKWRGGEGGGGSPEPTAGAKLEAPQASNWTCAQGGRRGMSECLISWHQDQPSDPQTPSMQGWGEALGALL